MLEEPLYNASLRYENWTIEKDWNFYNYWHYYYENGNNDNCDMSPYSQMIDYAHT